MKKPLRIIITIILILVIIFMIFLSEECLRLKWVASSKPLIITDQTKLCVTCLERNEEAEIEYYSLGFKYKVRYVGSVVADEPVIIGEEFWLFNKIIVWGYIS
jgi:ABC-type microcin C transport system permease subunit YejE